MLNSSQSITNSLSQALQEDPRLPWSDDQFNSLALALFQEQFRTVPTYRAWCQHELSTRGTPPADITRWEEIPALPIAAFKQADVLPDDVGAVAATWFSSGTTADQTSRHALTHLDLYDISLRASSRAALSLEDDTPLLAVQLAPAASDAPHSSLSHMFDAIRRECSDGGAWVNAAMDVDSDGMWERLRNASADQRPVLLLATSFALVQLFDGTAHRTPITLPEGSRIVDTGGYKGRTRTVDRDELLHCIEDRLGVSTAMVENEYGMSELSTQAWLGTIARTTGTPLQDDVVESGVRWQPPWMRTRVVDPVSLAEVADGSEGLLVHHDLANAYSCAAIRTEDWGRRAGASYVLLGRAPGAQIRGCSLQLEDAL